MQSSAQTVSEYIKELPEDRKKAIELLRKTINKNLPKGFKEGMSYGMMGWFVPHSIYPNGYHCKPSDPLPFAGLASQKNNISFYHMGVYSMPNLLEWFTTEYSKLNLGKLDMGKSCVRFKKMDKIPYDLIGELCSKITVEQWIECYETVLNKKK
ncbi:MAG TPA: DUF1801 domain-containing protein [Chitinophagaceae bacterium]|jgi:uncharacterized protein YdhG (YjbR/CyaY superfamily)|nr:DUF1801 domain-containing protein [Chitinophagaceae bacterium]